MLDKEKAKARKQRFLQNQKVKKYGEESRFIDMRGKHGNQATGERNARWNHEKLISSHGYVKVRVGKEHPLADSNGYAYEHLIVWCSAGKPKPESDELIHHRNEDKTDNRLSNLELKKRDIHAVDHIKNRERDESGRFN